MSTTDWTAIDAYIADHLVGPDPTLDEALTDSEAAGLPAIAVASNQGKLLHILALSIGARRIVEVGTLGGYSAIWMARALPSDGELVTLEIDPASAEVARKNLERAGVGDRVEVIVGPAIDTLPALNGPFDLAFIDANKSQNPDYFQIALGLVRSGGLIIVDNVVREGRILDAASTDENVRGVRRLFEMMGKEPRVTVTAVQTVGSKGHDGFAIARVN
jgi:predicted O-methyltransferase YrrM